MYEYHNQDLSKEISAWVKTALKFWESFQGDNNYFKNIMPDDKKSYAQSKKMFQTGNNIFKLLLSLLSEPENVNALLKGSEVLPEFFLDLIKNLMEGSIEFQKKWTEHITNIGKHSKAYSFDDINQDIFTTWKNIYEDEFKKYLNIPQLGLNRYYHERINQLADKYNLFNEALLELLYIFYVPFEKTNIVMQEKIEELLENGEIFDNVKDYYTMWLRILEGHYMTLLKSPEYIKVMKNTILAFVQYKKAKDAVLYDLLQHVPIPTNKDMDELYKEIYLLKKQVRDLSNIIKSNNITMNTNKMS